jgi:hypothetical protein
LGRYKCYQLVKWKEPIPFSSSTSTFWSRRRRPWWLNRRMMVARLHLDNVYERNDVVTTKNLNEANFAQFFERNKRLHMVGLESEISACQLHEPFYFSPPRQSCLTFPTCLCRPEYHSDIVGSNNIVCNRTVERGIQYLLGLCVVYTSSLVVDTNKAAQYVFFTSKGKHIQ